MKHIAINLFFRKKTNSITEIWFQRRSESGPLDGFLEFPGGKIETGESPRAACVREVGEEVGLLKEEELAYRENLLFFKFYQYDYEDRSVMLYVFLSPMELQGFKSKGKYISVETIKNDPEMSAKILPANLQIIDEVLDFLTISDGYRSFNNAWQLLSQSQYFF